MTATSGYAWEWRLSRSSATSGFDLWDEWSRTADNYDQKAARTTWRSITPDGGVTLGTLYHEAQQHGFRFNGETRPQPPTAEEIAERDRREQENEGARQRAQEDAAKKAELSSMPQPAIRRRIPTPSRSVSLWVPW